MTSDSDDSDRRGQEAVAAERDTWPADRELRLAGALRIVRGLMDEMQSFASPDRDEQWHGRHEEWMSCVASTCRMIVGIQDVRSWEDNSAESGHPDWKVELRDQMSDRMGSELWIWYRERTDTWWMSFSEYGSPGVSSCYRADGTYDIDESDPEYEEE